MERKKGVVDKNLQQIEARISDACTRAGRDRTTVTLMAVSKRQPPEQIQEALDLGLRLFGESRVQETREKLHLFPDDAVIHLIGHLQRNKARDAAEMYHAVQSLDAVRTVTALESRLAENGRTLPVMIEVNTSGEESKQGVTSFDQLQTVAAAVLESQHMSLRGLMTIGPISRDEARLRHAFSGLRDFRDRLTGSLEVPLPELSMGMSNDLEAAILEGATLVRVGTALFGDRA